MTTLAEFMIIAGADNRPPMLEKSMYDSWKSRMKLYIENRENGRMILNSVLNGPLIWPTIEENGTTRTKKYEELSVLEKLQADCDLKATNIVLQGLPPDVYAIVNHHKVAKDIWDRVKLLMQGTKLSLQEKECKLYDEFDKFSFVKGEILYHKFVTDVKLARDLHTTNYDQLYSYLEQHEAHANETRLMHERYQYPLAFVANYNQPPSHLNNYHSQYNATQFPQQSNTMIPQVHSTQSYSPMYTLPPPSQPLISHSSVPPSHQYQSQMDHQTSSVPQNAYHSPQISTQPMTEFPQMDSGLAIPVFSPGDDTIAYLNTAVTFLIAVASSRFPSTDNQLRTSSNPRNQATIQDGRVTVQQVQGRQGQSYAGTGYKGNATSFGGNNTGGQARFKEKATLAEAQESGQILDEEQLAFLADPGILDGQAAQTTIPNNAAFQTEDLDAYDSDCDDVSNAKAVLMANLSNYGYDVISEYLQETQQEVVQDTNLYAQQDSMILSVIEQMSVQMLNHKNNWEKANQEKNNESLTIELERYKERVKTFEQRLNIDLSTREKMIDSQMDDMIKEKLALKQQIDSLEQNLSNQIKEKESLLQTFTVFKNESKEKESKYMENKIDLEKKIKELDNIVYKKAQRIKPTLYDGCVTSCQHAAMLVIDDDETLILEELNKLSYFGKRFVPQQELSAEQAFWLQTSNPNTEQSDISPGRIEAPSELPKMEAVVQQCSVDKQYFEIVKKELFLENDRLLQQIMSQDVLLSVMNSTTLNDESVNLDMQRSESCDKCFDLDAELLKTQNSYNELLKSYSQLEKHCISLELSIQLNKKFFKRTNPEHIKSMRENVKEEKVKQDMDEIETINIELEHSVAKLLSENERLHKEIDHLKQIYKDQFDSIKRTRVRTKEHSESLILQLNLKSVENADLKAQIQDKEQADVLRGIVEQAKAKQPLDNALDFALLKSSTSASRSQPTCNKKNDRISQTPSSNMKNKVEA
ncbi:hypothetical protein Tco_0097166 [Tanacetum coccineum]